MNIIKYTNRLDVSKLSLNNTNNIDSIAIHHMDHPTGTIDDVCSWHMDGNGWSWIGYGYWIGLDGKVYECRGYKYLNSAVANNNGHIVSIGFQGQYNQNNVMPTAQFNSGVELIKYLKTQLPNVKTISGHKYWNPTSCPGAFFPLTKMIEQSNQVINQPAQWQLDCLQYLYDNKYLLSPHLYNEIITINTIGYILNNATLKQTNIQPTTWLVANGYTRSLHLSGEQVSVSTFGYMMANLMNETVTIDILDWLLQKGFLTVKRTDRNELLTMWLLGAMLKNARMNGFDLSYYC